MATYACNGRLPRELVGIVSVTLEVITLGPVELIGPTLSSELASYSALGWKTYVQPEGQRYYYHPEFRIVTDVNLQDDSLLDLVKAMKAEFEERRTGLHITTFPEDYEVYFDVVSQDDWRYYMVDYATQSIFYLESIDATQMFRAQFDSKEHLRMKLMENFWKHVETFPAHRSLLGSHAKELRQIFMQGCVDQATSLTCHFPASQEQSKLYIDLLANIQGNIIEGAYDVWVVARLMKWICQSRFVNYHGLPGARLDRVIRVDGAVDEKQLPLKILPILSLILCLEPSKELSLLDDVIVDNNVYGRHWEEYVRTRLSNWKEVMSGAGTLLLINSIMSLHFQGFKSPTDVVNIIEKTGCQSLIASILLNMISLATSLSAISAFQPLCTSSIASACEFLNTVQHSKYGYQPLSILLGLPRALFLWAVFASSLSAGALSVKLFREEILSWAVFIALGAVGGAGGWSVWFLHLRGREGL